MAENSTEVDVVAAEVEEAGKASTKAPCAPRTRSRNETGIPVINIREFDSRLASTLSEPVAREHDREPWIKIAL